MKKQQKKLTSLHYLKSIDASLKTLIRFTQPPDKKEASKSLAFEMLGKDFLSPSTVAIAFTTTHPDVPPPPLTRAELDAAKAAGQMLIYRLPGLTMRDIVEKTRRLFKNGDKLLWNTGWYADEAFYTTEVTRGGWALVSKEITPNTTDKNYAEQTAIVGDNRRRACEVVYDLAVYYAIHGECLLSAYIYDWTSSRSSDGRFVYVGSFRPAGVHVSRNDPYLRDGILGASLSKMV